MAAGEAGPELGTVAAAAPEERTHAAAAAAAASGHGATLVQGWHSHSVGGWPWRTYAVLRVHTAAAGAGAGGAAALRLQVPLASAQKPRSKVPAWVVRCQQGCQPKGLWQAGSQQPVAQLKALSSSGRLREQQRTHQRARCCAGAMMKCCGRRRHRHRRLCRRRHPGLPAWPLLRPAPHGPAAPAPAGCLWLVADTAVSCTSEGACNRVPDQSRGVAAQHKAFSRDSQPVSPAPPLARNTQHASSSPMSMRQGGLRPWLHTTVPSAAPWLPPPLLQSRPHPTRLPAAHCLCRARTRRAPSSARPRGLPAHVARHPAHTARRAARRTTRCAHLGGASCRPAPSSSS
eukprot:365930-Chlamydomonas_euryale.AAC.18